MNALLRPLITGSTALPTRGGGGFSEAACLRGETVEKVRGTECRKRISARHEGHIELVKSLAAAFRDMLTFAESCKLFLSVRKLGNRADLAY